MAELHRVFISAMDEAESASDFTNIAQLASKELITELEYYEFRASFFRHSSNPYFNLQLSEEALLEAFKYDQYHVPWMLHGHYISGTFGRIDLDRARHFREIAIGNGFPGAISSKLSDLLTKSNSLANGENLTEDDTEFLNKTIDDPTRGPPIGWIVAGCHFAGIYVRQDKKGGHELLLALARVLDEPRYPPPPSVSAAIINASISLFEISDWGDRNEARRLLAYIKPAKTVERFDLTNSLKADRIRHIFNMEDEYLGIDSSSVDGGSKAQTIKDVRKFISEIWNAKTVNDGWTIARDYETQGFAISDEIFLLYLSHIMTVSDWCRGHMRPVYLHLKQTAEFQKLKVSQSQVEENTLNEGFKFNICNGPDPIVGKTQWPDQAGFSSIEGIELDEHGVHIVGKETDEHPLVFKNDIIDALAFAFGWDQCLWPSLSIEPVEAKTATSTQLGLRRKVFNPIGFEFTDIGKTFFRTDWLLCRIKVFDPKFILAANPSVSAETLTIARQIFDGFGGLGGIEIGTWGRVMLRPSNVKVDELTNKNVKSKVSSSFDARNFRVSSLDILVDGAGCIDIDSQTSIRNIKQNDPRFASGRRAKYFTDNMPLIKEIIPVYARLEQLYRLMAVFGHIREKNISIPEHVRQMAIKRAHEIANSKSSADNKLIVLP